MIKPAVRQVNETSDLSLEVDYQRDRRRVMAVRFRVSDNPQMLLFAQRQSTLAALAEDEADSALPPVDASERAGRLRSKLAALGLNARQIRMAMASHASDYLEENIAVVERDLVAGKVHNLPAYLLAALREDYRPVPARTESVSQAAPPDAAAPAE